MSTESYDDILRRAQRELSPLDQLRLVEELSRDAGASSPRRNICELKGLGKDAWQGIDPDAYVRKERDSWSG